MKDKQLESNCPYCGDETGGYGTMICPKCGIEKCIKSCIPCGNGTACVECEDTLAHGLDAAALSGEEKSL